jgi:hypothetical protein
VSWSIHQGDEGRDPAIRVGVGRRPHIGTDAAHRAVPGQHVEELRLREVRQLIEPGRRQLGRAESARTRGVMDQPVSIAPTGLRPTQAAQYLGVGVTFLASLLSVPLRVRGNGKGKGPL